MTFQDILDYRRWAENMFEESKLAPKVNCREYYYLKEWIEKFDRIYSTITCYPEYHNIFTRGLDSLKLLCKSL